jgi:hypothetical protein
MLLKRKGKKVRKNIIQEGYVTDNSITFKLNYKPICFVRATKMEDGKIHIEKECDVEQLKNELVKSDVNDFENECKFRLLLYIAIIAIGCMGAYFLRFSLIVSVSVFFVIEFFPKNYAKMSKFLFIYFFADFFGDSESNASKKRMRSAMFMAVKACRSGRASDIRKFNRFSKNCRYMKNYWKENAIFTFLVINGLIKYEGATFHQLAIQFIIGGIIGCFLQIPAIRQFLVWNRLKKPTEEDIELAVAGIKECEKISFIRKEMFEINVEAINVEEFIKREYIIFLNSTYAKRKKLINANNKIESTEFEKMCCDAYNNFFDDVESKHKKLIIENRNKVTRLAERNHNVEKLAYAYDNQELVIKTIELNNEYLELIKMILESYEKFSSDFWYDDYNSIIDIDIKIGKTNELLEKVKKLSENQN